MPITILGMLVLPLSILWASNPVRLLQTALVSAIFQAGSALIIGGSFGLPVAMVPGLVFITYVIFQYGLGMRYGAEGLVFWVLTPLIALLGYAILSAMFLPDAFAGSIMVFPQRPDPLEISLVPLAFNSGNITQTLYIMMNVSICTVTAIFLTRAAIPYKKIVGSYLLGGYVVVGLSLWQFASRISGVPFIGDVLYSNPNFAIVEQAFGAVPRIQGPFAEPAALAFYISGLCFCCLWLTVQGHRVMRVGILLGLVVLTQLLSTSTTGIVTLAVGFPLILIFALARADRRTVSRLVQTIAAMILACGIMFGTAVVANPGIFDAVSVVVEATLSKNESDSYNDRTGLDMAAIDTVGSTYGLGVGWGSFRSSSLIPGLLANGGIVGVALILWFGIRVVRLILRASAVGRGHPGKSLVDGFSAALCGQLTAALLSAPTIDSLAFFLQLGGIIGTCARMVIDTRVVASVARQSITPRLGVKRTA